MELRPEDRGWNDPPVVTFTETNQGVKRGKLLNKRIAFPINGSVGGPAMSTGYPTMQTSAMQAGPMPVQGQESYMYNSPQRMPGGPSYYQQPTDTYYPQQQSHVEGYCQPNTYMPTGTVEQPQPVQYHQEENHQPVPQMANDSMLHLDEAIRNFNALMNSLSPGTLNMDEVGRYLQLLQSMWRQQKLSPQVQDMIFKLSVALCHGDTSHAESLLSSLNTNHYHSCHEWIFGPSTLLQAISAKPSVF